MSLHVVSLFAGIGGIAPKCRRTINPLDTRTRRLGYVCSIDCRIDLDSLPRMSEVGR